MFKVIVINKGYVIFTSICKTQHRTTEGTMHLGAFLLSAAHLEFLGLMVTAWKTLRRQVVATVTPLATL